MVEKNRKSSLTGILFVLLIASLVPPAINFLDYTVKAYNIRKEMETRASELTLEEREELNKQYFHYREMASKPSEWYKTKDY